MIVWSKSARLRSSRGGGGDSGDVDEEVQTAEFGGVALTAAGSTLPARLAIARTQRVRTSQAVASAKSRSLTYVARRRRSHGRGAPMIDYFQRIE